MQSDSQSSLSSLNERTSNSRTTLQSSTIRRLKPIVRLAEEEPVAYSRIRRLKPVVKEATGSQESEQYASIQNESISFSEFQSILKNETQDSCAKSLSIQLNKYKFGNFVALDFETANHHSHICEIGLCVVRNFQVVDSYDEYIKPPGNFYDPRWIEIHGITPKTTRNSRTFDQAWPEIFEKYIKNRLVVCHSAKTADTQFLYRNVKRYELDVPIFPFVDTCSLAYFFIDIPAEERKGQYRLNALCERYNIEQKQHHNALDDAICCAKLFLKEIEVFQLKSYFEIRSLNAKAYGEFPACKLQKNNQKLEQPKTKSSPTKVIKKEVRTLDQEVRTSDVVVLSWSAAKDNIYHINITKIENSQQTEHKSWLIKPHDCSIYYEPKHAAFFSYKDLVRAPMLKNIYQEVYDELNNKTVLVCREQQGPVLKFIQSLQKEDLPIFNSQFFYSFEIFKKYFKRKDLSFQELSYMSDELKVRVKIADKLDKQYSSLVSAEVFLKLVQALKIETFNEMHAQHNITVVNFADLCSI